MRNSEQQPKWYYHPIKRSFDVVISLLAITVVFVPCVIVGVAIKLSDGGEVFHKRACLGKGEKPFQMLKFRSMVEDSDNLEKYLSKEELELYLKGDKSFDDPRITRLGRFLRVHNIDELPQLLNVLVGEMSLIGPRPVTAREAQTYGKNEDLLLSVRPGITGYWQVIGRSSVPYLSEEAKKLQLYYVEHQGIALDAKIIVLTVKVLFKRTGK